MYPAVRVLSRTIACLLLCAGLLFGQGTTFTLLHVNDTHSHLDAVGPKDAHLNGTLGGIAKAAAVIGRVRATEQNVLLLHAGDLFQGDPIFNTYFGVPEFQLMKQLGFDAMTVGNHEFGYGPAVLNDVLSAAFAGGSFPLLSANIDMSGYPPLQHWIQPSIIKTIGGAKIGIFGMTVPGDPTTFPDPVIIQTDIVPIAQQAIDNLRSGGADIVICLSHLGFFYDKILVSNVTGLDLVIGGHDHFLFTKPQFANDLDGNPVPILQAGEQYKYIGRLKCSVENGHLSIVDYRILNVNACVPAVPEIQNVVEGLKQGVSAKFGDLYHVKIGCAVRDLDKHYDEKSPIRDTPMGNLVTDAFREKTHTDLAITALGLISEKIYRGAIVPADVFRSLSYGFDEETGKGLKLATIDLTGAELVKGMEIGLSQLEVGDDFFLQYSGLKFRYDPQQPVGQRAILRSVRIHGKHLDLTATYSVTINTGLVALLGLMGVNATNITLLPDFEYDVVKDAIVAMGRVHECPEGRIIERKPGSFLKESDEDGSDAPVVTEYSLHDNFPNPFNPSTTFRYDVPVEGHVLLKIYSALGQEVATVVDQTLPAGHYEARWDASSRNGGLPSGVYFYRMEAGRFSSVKKMMLLK